MSPTMAEAARPSSEPEPRDRPPVQMVVRVIKSHETVGKDVPVFPASSSQGPTKPEPSGKPGPRDSCD